MEKTTREIASFERIEFSVSVPKVDKVVRFFRRNFVDVFFRDYGDFGEYRSKYFVM